MHSSYNLAAFATFWKLSVANQNTFFVILDSFLWQQANEQLGFQNTVLTNPYQFPSSGSLFFYFITCATSKYALEPQVKKSFTFWYWDIILGYWDWDNIGMLPTKLGDATVLFLFLVPEHCPFTCRKIPCFRGQLKTWCWHHLMPQGTSWKTKTKQECIFSCSVLCL